jgi:hypothetical protein
LYGAKLCFGRDTSGIGQRRIDADGNGGHGVPFRMDLHRSFGWRQIQEKSNLSITTTMAVRCRCEPV